MTADKDNYHYLRGFIDGYGGEEPHDDFPEGFSNINEVFDRVYELQEPNPNHFFDTPIGKKIGIAAEHYFGRSGVKEYAGLYMSSKLIDKIVKDFGYTIESEDLIETAYGALHVNIYEGDHEAFSVGDVQYAGKDPDNRLIIRYNPEKGRLEKVYRDKITPLEEAVV